jgi:hypothetical protein
MAAMTLATTAEGRIADQRPRGRAAFRYLDDIYSMREFESSIDASRSIFAITTIPLLSAINAQVAYLPHLPRFTPLPAAREKFYRALFTTHFPYLAAYS